MKIRLVIIILVTLLMANMAYAADNVIIPIVEPLDDVWEDEGDEGFVYNTGRLDTSGTVGLRFVTDIPPRSQILNAHIHMALVDKGNADHLSAWLWVAATANPAQFTTEAFNVTSRAKIPLAVPWDVGSYDYAFWGADAGEIHQTPDVTDLLQKLANRAGWEGTAMFFVTPNASQATAVFASEGHPFYDGPTLVVEYVPRNATEIALPSGRVGELIWDASMGDIGIVAVAVSILMVLGYQLLRRMVV